MLALSQPAYHAFSVIGAEDAKILFSALFSHSLSPLVFQLASSSVFCCGEPPLSQIAIISDILYPQLFGTLHLLPSSCASSDLQPSWNALMEACNPLRVAFATHVLLCLFRLHVDKAQNAGAIEVLHTLLEVEANGVRQK